MDYNKITKPILEQFRAIVGAEYTFIDTTSLEKYGQDKTEDLLFWAEVVLLPQTVEQISQIMQICHSEKIPVVPRGAGTGLAGGALPVCGGVVLSTELLNQILAIDTQNLQVICEPAVITEVLQNKVKEKGLFYPPDPSSKGSSFIGGNVSTNAGGPRAVKYGVVKDYVLNLEVILPTGEVIWTGANTLKNSTGYNLTQLLVGSEGTLGIITKIVLKLIPLPSHSLLLLASFRSSQDACAAVSAIFRAGITPSCLEFMERGAIQIAKDYLGDIAIAINEKVQAHLLIEVDGNHLDSLYADCEKLSLVLEDFDCNEILFADNATQKNDLWKLRRNISNAIKQKAAVKKADTVVPRAALPQLLEGMKHICHQNTVTAVSYGHAGDGNLHINILKEEAAKEDWESNANQAIKQIFCLVKELKGTISGEHGVGWIQRPYMSIVFSEVELNLMRTIKQAFDPHLILNPMKVVF